MNQTLVIHPYTPVNLRGSSYHLTLGEEYFQSIRPETSYFYGQVPPELNTFDRDDSITMWGPAKKSSHGMIRLEPKATILTTSQELLGYTDDLLAMGSSLFPHRGFDVRVVFPESRHLERPRLVITNLTDLTLCLPVGERIASLSLYRTGNFPLANVTWPEIEHATRSWNIHSILPRD